MKFILLTYFVITTNVKPDDSNKVNEEKKSLKLTIWWETDVAI